MALEPPWHEYMYFFIKLPLLQEILFNDHYVTLAIFSSLEVFSNILKQPWQKSFRSYSIIFGIKIQTPLAKSEFILI